MSEASFDQGWESLSTDVGEFPFELTLDEVANASRRAYMKLIVGAHVGWGKVELARWLTGPYKRLVDLAKQSEPKVERTSDPPVSSVTDDRVTALLEYMRTDALVVMNELMTPHGLSAFTTLAFDTRLVMIIGDDDESFIVPQTRTRMSLVDRVLSLVAVDAITRPEDFEHSLFVCERCHQPVFDVASRPLNVCRIHVSGVTRK